MTAELRKELPPLPDRMKSLPLDERGFPVPWFVATVDGKPDFRVIGPGKISAAVNKNLCWICGQPKGIYHAFVIGPMCAVNRVNSEPPSHLDCAEFAARACPFLIRPRMRRNDKDIPPDTKEPAGFHLPHNPGATCVWVTKRYQPFKVDNGVLFRIGDPIDAIWYCEGRRASRAEVEVAIARGAPHLMDAANKDGIESLNELAERLEWIKTIYPP
jgi:hypothetical protein